VKLPKRGRIDERKSRHRMRFVPERH